MENTCRHENGGESVGNNPTRQQAWKKYEIDKQSARKHGVSTWKLYVCNDCGKIIDEETGEIVTAQQLGSYIDDLMLIHDVRIIEFVEAL